MISIIVFKAALLFLLWAALIYTILPVDETKEIRIRAADAQPRDGGDAWFIRKVGQDHMDRYFGKAVPYRSLSHESEDRNGNAVSYR